MFQTRSAGIRVAFAVLLVGVFGVVSSWAEEVQQRLARNREARLAMGQGRTLTAEQAAELAAGLEQNPSAVLERIQLAGYYQRPESRDREQLRAQALWMIEHQPEWCFSLVCGLDHYGGAVAYEQGRDLWLAHLEREPDNATLLSHAASYFMQAEIERSIELLEIGMKLEPDYPLWATRLSGAYSRQARYGDESQRAGAADRAFEVLLGQYNRSPKGNANKLADLAVAALAAEEFEEAERFAGLALDSADRLDAPTRGRVVYSSHWALGLIALQRDDVDDARDHLLASGDLPDGYVVSHYRPDMRLADQLARRGELEVVIRFLEKCRAFWMSSEGRLDHWISTLRKDEVPEFGRF